MHIVNQDPIRKYDVKLQECKKLLQSKHYFKVNCL